MKFQQGESVIILNTLWKPAGTARIISYNDNNSIYAVAFCYPGSDKEEEFEIPEHRILTDSGFKKSRFYCLIKCNSICTF